MAQPKGTKRRPYQHHQPPRQCKFPGCTNIFTPTNANQHYCSAVHTKCCEYCGNSFVVKNLVVPSRTCSKQCARMLAASHTSYDAEWDAKRVKTNLIRTGYCYPMQNPVTQQKAQATCFKHFGTLHPAQSDTVKDTTTFYFRSTYNVDYPCQLPQCKAASRSRSKLNIKFQKFLERYGLQVEPEKSLGNYIYDFHILNTNVLIELNPTITHNSYLNIFKGDPVSADYHKNKSDFAYNNGYICICVWDWMNVVDLIYNLLYSRKFEIHRNVPKLHYYREHDDSHIDSLGDIDNTVIQNGYLPVYDDGYKINYLF